MECKVKHNYYAVLLVSDISGGDDLLSIRVFRFVNNDSGNSFVLAMCSIVLHSFR